MKHRRWGLLGMVVLLGCSAPAPAVEVRTAVGNRFERSDAELQRTVRAEVEQSSVLAPETTATRVVVPVPAVFHPPRTEAELEALIESIRKGPVDDMAGPAQRIARSDPALWPSIKVALQEPRPAGKVDYQAVLDAIGGDVPDRYGRFTRTWKLAHGHSVKLSRDWFADLLALPRTLVSPALLPVYRDCVIEVALLQAATFAARGSDPGTTADIVDTLLEVAYAHGGTFRDEVGRAIEGIGDLAIPRLILRSIVSPTDDEAAQRRAQYALYNLGRMNRLHAEQALASVRHDPRLLMATLTAYGTATVEDATESILEFVDDPNPEVRKAARHAFEPYLNGTAPPVRHQKVRRLGGTLVETRGSLTYRERAIQSLAARTAALPLPTDPLHRWTGYLQHLDACRQNDAEQRILAALHESRLEDAVGLLDRLLIESPELAGRSQVASVFARFGQQLERSGQWSQAAAQYRKAAVLTSTSSVATPLHVAALLNEAQVSGSSSVGRPMLLERARALAPEHPFIHQAALRANRSTTFESTRLDNLRFTEALGAMFGFLVAVAMIGRKLRTDHRQDPKPA